MASSSPKNGLPGSGATDAIEATDPDGPILYGGFTRFEIELEFVQSLANPWYLNHLASQKLLTQPAFVRYLAYLRYWTRPPYLRFLTYPGPTLRYLQLLQMDRFRRAVISPDVAARLADEGVRAVLAWHAEAAEPEPLPRPLPLSLPLLPARVPQEERQEQQERLQQQEQEQEQQRHGD